MPCFSDSLWQSPAVSWKISFRRQRVYYELEWRFKRQKMHGTLVLLDLDRSDLTISKNFKRKTPSRYTDLLGVSSIFRLQLDRRCNAQRNSDTGSAWLCCCCSWTRATRDLVHLFPRTVSWRDLSATVNGPFTAITLYPCTPKWPTIMALQFVSWSTFFSIPTDHGA